MLLLFFLCFFNSLFSSAFHLGLFRVSSNPVEEKVSAFTSKLFSMGPSQYSAWYWSALYNQREYTSVVLEIINFLIFCEFFSDISFLVFVLFMLCFYRNFQFSYFPFLPFSFSTKLLWFCLRFVVVFFNWANFLVLVFFVFSFLSFSYFMRKLAVSYSYVYFLHFFIYFHFPFCFFVSCLYCFENIFQFS